MLVCVLVGVVVVVAVVVGVDVAVVVAVLVAVVLGVDVCVVEVVEELVVVVVLLLVVVEVVVEVDVLDDEERLLDVVVDVEVEVDVAELVLVVVVVVEEVEVLDDEVVVVGDVVGVLVAVVVGVLTLQTCRSPHMQMGAMSLAVDVDVASALNSRLPVGPCRKHPAGRAAVSCVVALDAYATPRASACARHDAMDETGEHPSVARQLAPTARWRRCAAYASYSRFIVPVAAAHVSASM